MYITADLSWKRGAVSASDPVRPMRVRECCADNAPFLLKEAWHRVEYREAQAQ
jgi:hypothetical protein